MNFILNQKRFFRLFWLLICCFYVQTANGEIYIIANTSIPVDALSESEIRDFYIGKRVVWNGNLKIVPVIVPLLDLHDEFCLKYSKKSIPQLKNWWLRLVFSGEGVFPKQLPLKKR